MSDVFIIITLSALVAIWAAAVLRRPGAGLQTDPIDAILGVWLQLPRSPSQGEAGPRAAADDRPLGFAASDQPHDQGRRARGPCAGRIAGVTVDALLQRPPLVLSARDRRRIQGLALDALLLQPRLAGPLLREADRASTAPDAVIPAAVAGVGSWVRYRDVGAGETRRVRLVAKRHADATAGELSLLDPIGAALVGLAAGQRILWADDLAGPRLLELLTVSPALAPRD